MKKEIGALTAEFHDVQTQIRRRSPHYAALTQPEPLALREIQALLDPDTLLLEYALGDERSYLWAVTPTSINSFELPKRSAIETEVRSRGQPPKRWQTMVDERQGRVGVCGSGRSLEQYVARTGSGTVESQTAADCW